MPSLNEQLVEHGAFIAVALSDGESASALLSRSGPGLRVEEGDSLMGTREIIRTDSQGVPSAEHLVRLRVYRRGRSALVTALAGDGMDLNELSQTFERVLSGLPAPIPTVRARSSRTIANHYTQAQGSIPQDVFDTVLALGAGEPSDVLTRVVAVISGLPCQGESESVTPSVQWPCTPRTALESIERGGDPMIRVLLSTALPSDQGCRELERHGPDIQGQLGSVTAVRGASTVKLLVRTADGVEAAQVLSLLTKVMSHWAAAPETSIAAPDLTSALGGSKEAVSNTATDPRDEQEHLLINEVRRVLQLPEEAVSLRDNFFSLGGDSMTALQLVTALGALGWQLEVRDVFLSANLKTLASRMCTASREETVVTPMSASGLDEGTLNLLLSEEG